MIIDQTTSHVMLVYDALIIVVVYTYKPFMHKRGLYIKTIHITIQKYRIQKEDLVLV